MVPGCLSVERYTSGNQVEGDGDVEVRVNKVYERESNSAINSNFVNDRRVSADFAILRFLCRGTDGSVVSGSRSTLKSDSDSQALIESVIY